MDANLKDIKRIRKILVKILAVFLLLFLSMGFLFSLPVVQTKIGTQVSRVLKQTYDVDITIDKIAITVLGEVALKDILIKDYRQDTLIAAEKLSSKLFKLTSLLDNKLNLGNSSIENGVFYMKTYQGDSLNNLTVFSRKFAPKKKRKNRRHFKLVAPQILMKNIHFELSNFNQKETPVVYYRNIKGLIKDFDLNGSNVSLKVSDVSLNENHQVTVENLTTGFSYQREKMVFDQFSLLTKNSNISGNLQFDYQPEDMKNFVNAVRISADKVKAKVSLVDLKKFYKEFNGAKIFDVSTDFHGVLNDFKLKNFTLESGKLRIDGDYRFVNSVSLKKGFALDGRSREIVSNYRELKSILPNIIGKNLPSELAKLGDFTIKGETYITPDNLDLGVDVTSKIGLASVDLALTNIQDIDNATYDGYVNVTDIHLDKITGDPLYGLLSFEGEVQGQGFTIENINTSLIGVVSKHQYKNYTYSGIQVDGLFQNKLFNGSMSIYDPNISFDFSGLADFSSEVNKFDFEANVDYVDLKKLNLFTRDSIAILKGGVKIDFTGNSIDDIVGTASFENAAYTNEHDSYEFERLSLTSTRENNIRDISFQSKDVIDGTIKGVFKFNELFPMIQNSIGSMMTNYSYHKIDKKQFIEFDFQIFNKVIPVLSPEMSWLSSAVLKGKVLEENNEIKLLFTTPKIKYKKTLIDSVSLKLDNKNPAINTNFEIKQIKTPNYTLRDLNLYNKTLNDTLFFRSDFTGGKTNEERFGVVFYYTIDKDKNSVLGVLESKMLFRNNEWKINPKNNRKNKLVFNLEKETFYLEELELLTEGQLIKLDGVVRDSTFKDINMEFQQVDVGSILPKIDSLSMQGIINGDFNFKQEGGDYNPLGNVVIKDFTINNSLQGDLNMHINANDSYQLYNVDISLLKDQEKKLNAQGEIDIAPEIPSIDLKVNLSDFQLNAFSPLGKNVLSKLRGVAVGDFNVSGPLSNPEMNGVIDLVNAGFTFPYLNVDYQLVNNPQVTLEAHTFKFDKLAIEDTKHLTKGIFNGSITHSYYKNWYLDLGVLSHRLLVLDTKDGENVSYYGTGFMDGLATIKGTTNDLNINVKGKTLDGTRFVIPLNDVKNVESSGLIQFKKEEISTFEQAVLDEDFLKKQFQGLAVNLDIDVTPAAEAEIVIDRLSGSSLKGRGTGNLLLEIDSKGKFDMFGDFVVDQGQYNFIYGGVINKPFEIEKGGQISWDGNPMNANLNIRAIHRVKANPRVLLTDLTTSRKIPVDLITDISGSLFNSEEDFSINIPNSSSTVASELSFVLNNDDENATLRQFFSLLLAKSFFNEENVVSSGGSVLTGTTSDIISGALSDIFNEEGEKFQIDLGYTSGDKSQIQDYNIDNQVDISLKTQINDKILIDGNLGVPVGTKTQSNVIGEVKVEFLVDDEGKLRYTVFNRQNEVQYSQDEEGYTQGIGLVYRIDFNTVGEMFAFLRFKKKKRDTFESLENKIETEEKLFIVPTLL